MFVSTIKDVVARHPKASLAVIFVSAFTVCALSGGDTVPAGKKKKRNATVLHKVLSFVKNGDEESIKQPQALDSRQSSSNGISFVLGDEGNEKHVFHTCRGSKVAAIVGEQVGLPQQQHNHQLQQLQQLQQERNDTHALQLREMNEELAKMKALNESLRASVKREQGLRIEVEDNFHFQERELKKQRDRKKKLKTEKKQFNEVRVKLFEAQMRIQSLEQTNAALRDHNADLQSLVQQHTQPQQQRCSTTQPLYEHTTITTSNGSMRGSNEPSKKRILTIM
eukprot:TRINITY_DN3716_c0_g1_i1.p1 TRINITY_DN3716_c0_g1~~TRINITY_DN3716_c0_g1_i1.p1  ORF type:complete len:280 (-),score=91.99 TRINITY_DN3716_c0_g1_i1:35-874(-)